MIKRAVIHRSATSMTTRRTARKTGVNTSQITVSQRAYATPASGRAALNGTDIADRAA
jgi:hypothetical protein